MPKLSIQKTGLSGDFINQEAGTTIFYNAAQVADICDDWFDFRDADEILLYLKNESAQPAIISILSKECDQGYNHDISKEILPGEECFIGPLFKYRFCHDGQKGYITYSHIEGIKIALLVF